METGTRSGRRETGGVAVLGAGVSGLSCALALKEAHPKLPVTIIADKFTPDTVSDRSGALSAPEPAPVDPEGEQRNRRWFRQGLKRFHLVSMREDAEETGITPVFGYLLYSEEIQEPWFKNDVTGFRSVSSVERASMNIDIPDLRGCWSFGTFSVDCTKYLPWMMNQLSKRGVLTVARKVVDLQQLLDEGFDIVVNCTGLGARELVPDPDMEPMWGQGMTVHAPQIKYFVKSSHKLSNSSDYVYINIFPRTSDVFLGGIKAKGRNDTTFDPKFKAMILKKLTSIMPSLKNAPVLKEWTAIRPHRSTVRLERESFEGGKNVIHNYGHSGYGVNYSWGCALDVVALVDRVTAETSSWCKSKL